MKLKIVTVGKLSLKPVKALTEEYAKRIGRYLPIEFIDEKISKEDFLIVLDEKGKAFTSREFAGWLEEKKIRSVKNLAFLIGPGEGLSEEIKSKAQFVLSLSKMTLQHELALVILLEQIYRACTILKGEPYHK